MDESAMEIATGTIDDAEQFVVYRDLRVPGTTETYRQALGGFLKGNPFEAARGRIAVDMGAGIVEMEERDLVKTTGVVDDENEYTCWVECRLPGSDQVVHRSADVKLKKIAPMGSSVGGFG